MPTTASVDEPSLDELYPLAPAAPPVPRPGWSRRRRVTSVVLAGVLVGLAGGGVWWHRAVTGDPGLRFVGALNVFRSLTPGDKAGVVDDENALGHEAKVDFLPGAGLVAWINLYNGGSRDLRIEGIPPAGWYYWGLERAVTSADDKDYYPGGDEPMEPFTLAAGETRALRLDFRLAGCDPAGLQDGSSFITSLPVRYHTIGFTRTVSVPFDGMAISVETIGKCDQPILDGD